MPPTPLTRIDDQPQAPAPTFPVIRRVLPSAIVAAESASPSTVELQGFNIGCGGLSVLCRAAGHYLPVKLAQGQTSCCQNLSRHTDFSMQVLRMQLPANLPAGEDFLSFSLGAVSDLQSGLAFRGLAARESGLFSRGLRHMCLQVQWTEAYPP